ncbi:MAG: 5'-nucleotidase C-terminal domain-containing protein [Gammaproteobacteria bacterium]|nr:5'-nucleotidase C-terminal domain-containing protein [Gammaproteobacteria bacterium]
MARTLLVAALFLTACAATPEFTAEKTTGLTFIHLNDTYRVGAVEDGKLGGFGRVVTMVLEAQADGRGVRVLHGGDLLYPSLESQLWNGLQMVEALNFIDALAPVYFVAGNHEFDRRTPEHLVNALRESRFDWLGDNYRFDTGHAAANATLQSRFTFDHDGKTIGIFSLTSHVDDGGNDRDYVPVDRDYLGVAERVIEDFESQGVDLIIGLTHLYMATDLKVAKLRENHPTLAFVVGGHDHEPEFSEQTETSAAVMKGASNARAIWRIDVDFDDEGVGHIDVHMLNLGQGVAIDADYEQINQKWRARLLELYPFLEAKVGEAAFPMDATEETTRSQETAWGNFIVDQMLTAYGEPAADFAFINSGTLRIDDFIADDISFEDIGRTFGFSSFLRYMTISGAEFRQVMEAGYRGAGGSQGYFPQIAGFRVCVDRSQAVGQRIVSLQLPDGDTWQEIDAEQEYTLVVPDFLYGGGDGYKLPQERPVSRPGSELKYLVLDGVLRAQAEGRAIGEAVSATNARLFELSPDNKECFTQ